MKHSSLVRRALYRPGRRHFGKEMSCFEPDLVILEEIPSRIQSVGWLTKFGELYL